MKPVSPYRCALITGASAGLGEEFAIQLAPRVKTLVLVARRADQLERVAQRVRSADKGCCVLVFPVDLSSRDARDRFLTDLRGQQSVPDLLVNNAGFGDYGEFLTADWEKLELMIRVNIVALTHLTKALAPGMTERGGAVINVSSLASTLPIPDFAVYAATKAYVSSFSEALRIELREHRIRVITVCPGPVKTEFGEVSRRSAESPGMPAKKSFYIPKEQVVAESLKGLDGNVARIYPGRRIGLAAFGISLVPLRVLRFVMGFRPRRR